MTLKQESPIQIAQWLCYSREDLILQHFSRKGTDVFADYRYYPNQLVYHKVHNALNKRKNI